MKLAIGLIQVILCHDVEEELEDIYAVKSETTNVKVVDNSRPFHHSPLTTHDCVLIDAIS
jgi:hypothetical protein